MAQLVGEFTVYRVRQSRNHPSRHVRHAWYGRTWQAEWTDTVWCPRAYTRSGVERKARRWAAYPIERRMRMARRRRWIRHHITRRGEQ